VPGNRVSFDPSDAECALAEAGYPVFLIDGTNLCFPAFPNLAEEGYLLTGSAANSIGLTRRNYRITVTIQQPTI